LRSPTATAFGSVAEDGWASSAADAHLWITLDRKHVFED
jgi:hypothetical protein